MEQSKIQRNDPCPCGSGKKYKKCCLNKKSAFHKEHDQYPKFQYEPGSYGDVGNFMPSIACMKKDNNVWKYHFVIVKISKTFSKEDKAVAVATKDLDKAFKKREKTGLDITVGESLSSDGYVNVENFHIVNEN
jgi:hypothetical protein